MDLHHTISGGHKIGCLKGQESSGGGYAGSLPFLKRWSEGNDDRASRYMLTHIYYIINNITPILLFELVYGFKTILRRGQEISRH